MKLLRKAAALAAGLWHIYIHPGGPAYAEEQRLRAAFYGADRPRTPGLKTGIVVCVDGRTMHGGLSDRLRGICSVYRWCTLHRVPFYVHFTYPFRLQDYLAPNAADWVIGDDEMSACSDEAEPVVLMLHLLPSKLQKLRLARLASKAQRRQLHVYANSVMYDASYAEAFHELFRPVPALQAAVEKEVESIGAPFAAMVLRFQQLLGDFEEGDFPTLPAEEREALIERCLQKVDEVHSERCPERLVLITSDSVTFLRTARERLPYVRTISGQIVHMDFTLNADYEVYMKSFVDMLTLARAEKVFLLRTGQMYRSGFAQRAAAINRTPYEYIDF